MQVSRNLATPSLRAWRKRVVSSRRSPTFAEVLAIWAKCAKPISPASTAATLLSNRSSSSPAQIRAETAPPDMWHLALMQAKDLRSPERRTRRSGRTWPRPETTPARSGPSGPDDGRDNQSSRRRSRAQVPPPHHPCFTLYEHLFEESSKKGIN